MSNRKYKNEQYFLMDLVDNTIIAAANPPRVDAFHLLASGWKSVLTQSFDPEG